MKDTCPESPVRDQNALQQPEAISEKERLRSAFGLFGPSWQAFKLNWVLLIIAPILIVVSLFALIAALQIIVHFALNSGTTIDTAITTVVNVISIILGIAAVVFAIPLSAAFTYWVKLESVAGKRTTFKNAFGIGKHFLLRALGLAICRWVIIILGLILLIVPGLFMWRRYLLAPYYMVDKDIGIFDAMKLSAANSKEYSRALWPMLSVYVLIQIVGWIPFVGWVAAAVGSIGYNCAAAVRYTEIKSRTS